MAGTGAFHAAIEVYRVEWSYGFTDEGTGIFACDPTGFAARRACEHPKQFRNAMKYPRNTEALPKRTKSTFSTSKCPITNLG